MATDELRSRAMREYLTNRRLLAGAGAVAGMLLAEGLFPLARGQILLEAVAFFGVAACGVTALGMRFAKSRMVEGAGRVLVFGLLVGAIAWSGARALDWRYQQTSTGAHDRVMVTRAEAIQSQLWLAARGLPKGAVRFPENAAFLDFVATHHGAEDPLFSPWGGPQPQRKLVPVTPPLVGAKALAAGQRATAVRTQLGPGHPPDGRPFDRQTYGAWVYDHDRASDTYVLYGIGERAGQATVVTQVHGHGDEVSEQTD